MSGTSSSLPADVGVHEALAVLGRTANWLARDGGKNLARARYVEATLSPWAARVAPLGDLAGTLRDVLTGFDAESVEVRGERVGRLLAAIDSLRTQAGDAPAEEIEPRARLLPEGVGADVAPRPPEPAPVEQPRAEERRAQPDRRAEHRADRREDVRSERRDPSREDRRDDARADRREPHFERPRGERPREERPREERPVERPPEPPPEPRTFPLGAPEHTGEPVASLGVFGPVEIEALAAAGIETVADLLVRPPTTVERAGERLVDGVPPMGPVLLRGRVSARATKLSPSGARRHELRLTHDRGVVRCRWMGEVPAEVASLRGGAEAGLVGRYESDDDGAVLYEAEPLGIDGRGGDWLPRYGVAGVPDERFRAGVRLALRRYADALADHLPPEMIEKHKLLGLAASLRDVHFPSNASRRGRARMAFDELLQIQLGLALLRARPVRDRGIAHGVVHQFLAQALSLAGWYFTDAQEAAFDSIRRDLRRSQPMERLLQGDVGSGKAAVIRAAMLVVAESRQQVYYCAPDPLSAEHAWLFASEFFKSVGIEPVLLLGAPTRAQAEALKKGETLVVYGTHALYRQPPEARKVGLCVVEQHGGYGVPDLGAFEGQGSRPDLLVTTPTPVPALLAMTAYGQLAMTTIDSPPARGVDTAVVGADARAGVYASARESIAAGEQVILVFPLLRGGDLLSPSEARRLAQVLEAEYLPGARFAIFSGALSREERFRAYDDFQHRRADVLLATTVIEDGPIVPNASVMIVERADHFDLVRLHRLRNHVRNGWRRSRCYFVESEEPRPEARRALDLVAQESDGFAIADLDLAQRGVEAVLGDAASEAPSFAWAEPAQDRDTLGRARAEAFRLLVVDPGLKRRVHRALLNIVRARFGEEGFSEAAPPPTGAPPTADARRRRRRRGR